MDVFSVMTDRRSARAYLNRPVSRTDIEDILEYAGILSGAILLLNAALKEYYKSNPKKRAIE